MDNSSKDPLPMGRAALAKTFCAEWISEHGKVILLSFVTLIVLSFCLFQLAGKFLPSQKSDYLHIQKAFHAWVSKELPDAQLFSALEKPLKSHPELEAKFGAHIAQRLLSQGEVHKANTYASSLLKRAQELTSTYYPRFSRNTLLISQGKYIEALEEAKQLKVDLESDDVFWQGRDKLVRSGTILYAYNLMRIASLEGQVGSKEGELKAWDELVHNAGWQGSPANVKTYDPEAYALLAQNFTQGDISLLDYIEQRKKDLTQIK